MKAKRLSLYTDPSLAGTDLNMPVYMHRCRSCPVDEVSSQTNSLLMSFWDVVTAPNMPPCRHWCFDGKY